MGDDDRKLFEQALAELSADDVFRGKYGAPEDASSRRDREQADDEREALRDDEDYRAVQQLRDDQMMVQAFTGVQRIDSSKYHVAAPKQTEAADEKREK